MGVMTAAFAVGLAWVQGVIPGIRGGKNSRRQIFKKAPKWSALWLLISLASGVAAHVAGHAFLVSVLGSEHNFVILFDFSNLATWRWLGGAMLIGLLVVFLAEMYFSDRLPDWPYADVDEPRDGGREGFGNIEHTIR